MSSDRRDLFIYSAIVNAAPTVASVLFTVPVGQSWEVIHAASYHDDPGGVTGHLWGFRVNGVTFYLSAGENLAASIRTYLYDRYKGRENLVIHAGQSLYCLCSAPAAGKILSMDYVVEVRKGEMVGDNV